MREDKEMKKHCPCVSEIVTRRLSLYLRCLLMVNREGDDYISSKELAERFHLNADQIRKDLSYFGTFGKRGVGYNIEDTVSQLKELLGLTQVYNVAIAGAGNLGTALADYPRINRDSFKIVALFDRDNRKVGTKTKTGIPIFHISELEEKIKELSVRMGIISVPADAAQGIADRFVESGVKGIMNFAPVRIQLPPYIKTISADFKSQLEVLAYYVSKIKVGE
ncbi:MAG: redox-sensing transcriptional repressor Rex [Acidobacteria bacterium CG_4_9_14_3_um_filter_49_7]|nr:MAG: redox-sensing transcriptional repressor Rex [Acidobacteria bacterium CG_4_9_14_3_um_filter_49_7]